MISCVRLSLSVCLSVQKFPVLQIQAVLLVLNTFKLYKTLKTAFSVLRFARYTLHMLKILHFELVSWVHLSTTPRYLTTCTMRDDGLFLSSRKHTYSYTACRVCSSFYSNSGYYFHMLTGSCRFCFMYNRSCKIMFTNNIPCLQYKLSCMFTNNNKDQSGWRI